MADNVTTQELEDALKVFAGDMAEGTKLFVEGKDYSTRTELLNEVTKLQTEITAITEMDPDNDSVSIAESLQIIKEAISADGVVQDILTKILQNRQDILDEAARATGAEAGLQESIGALNTATNTNSSDISSLSDTVAANNTAVTDKVAAAQASSDRNQAVLDILTGDASVENSIANLLDVEKQRAKAAELSNRQISDENIAAAKEDLQAQINELTGGEGDSLSGLSDKINAEVARATDADLALGEKTDGNTAAIAEITAVLENTTNDDDELVKGLKTRMTDAEAAIVNAAATAATALETAKEELNASIEDITLKPGSMNMCTLKNAFFSGLGLDTSDCGGDGDGAVL